MPKILKVREMTHEESQSVERLAHSRTATARAVERGRIIWFASQGQRVAEIARRLGIRESTVRLWLKRFNEQGLAGLLDEPRPGRPVTYTPQESSVVIASALTDPKTLDLPFASWTLDRLEAYLNEKGIAIKRSRIDELLRSEGLRWRTQEHWFGERVDPDFAKKRGASPPCTPSRLRAVSS
jgi:transposase